MSQPIEQYSLCRYIGPGDGRMFIHKITEVGIKHVITWSQYKVGDEDTLGWSWMGTKDEFVKQFRPVVKGEV